MGDRDRLVSKALRWVAALFLLVGPCLGKEVVYLKTGFSLEVDSHSQEDQTLVVRTGGGILQFPTDQVLRIETLPDDASPSPKEKLASSDATFPELVGEAALLQGLEPELLLSVAKVESGLRQDAVSRKGALGLMQLMPATAAYLGIDPNHASSNAQGGAKYLRDLLIRYGGNSALALAAYNAGPAAVDRFGGVPPYAETRQYVLSVIREYERQKKAKQTSAVRAPAPVSTPTSTN